jgi:Endosomal/lysosomal potassium channel TMEM175
MAGRSASHRLRVLLHPSDHDGIDVDVGLDGDRRTAQLDCQHAERYPPNPREPWRAAFGRSDDPMAVERIVCFSDAVFAIAITLLVIEITVPEGGATGPELAHELGRLWWYATSRGRLVDEDLDPRLRRSTLLRALAAPVVFGVSIPLVTVLVLIGIGRISLAPILWALVVPTVRLMIRLLVLEQRRWHARHRSISSQPWPTGT